jgi:hypothetical protein
MASPTKALAKSRARNRLKRGRQIRVPVADIVGVGITGEQDPPPDRLGLADVPRQLTDGITLGILVAEGLEHPQGASGAAVVDEEKLLGTPVTGVVLVSDFVKLPT